MAKRQKSTISVAEYKIEEFAEDLGKILSHARNKAEGWLGQRKSIVSHLTQLRDEAGKLLGDLGHQVESAAKRGRRAGEARMPAPPRKRRKMSAAARKAIGDAQRKRWAKLKAAK